MAYNPHPMEGNTTKMSTNILSPNLLLRIHSTYKRCRPLKLWEQECSRGFSHRLLLSVNHIIVAIKMRKKYTTTITSSHNILDFSHRPLKVWKRRIDRVSCRRRFHLGPTRDRAHGRILEAVISLIRIITMFMRVVDSFLQNRSAISKTINL